MLNTTTRLDAVNEILGSVGRTPIASRASGGQDAALAERTLLSVSRTVQTRGWHWNTEYEVPLTRDGSGHISISSSAVKVDVSIYQYPDINPVQRGSKFYDVKNRTYVFKQDLEAEIVYLLDFEEMPEVARQYITVRAARLFQDRYFSDMEAATLTRDEESRAFSLLNEHEVDNSDLNIFQNNFSNQTT